LFRKIGGTPLAHGKYAMARCYQCGTQTHLYTDGSPVCSECNSKLGPAPIAPIWELNNRLSQARDQYRRAVEAQRQVAGPESSIKPESSSGSVPLYNANLDVELTARKFREALRDFVAALQRRNE
jgi:hypothetical protein